MNTSIINKNEKFFKTYFKIIDLDESYQNNDEDSIIDEDYSSGLKDFDKSNAE